MSGYELQQFVMVSPEVWQDLHLRYVESLRPWWWFFLLLNLLVLLKNQRRLFFSYVALCWVFLGGYYFMHYVNQVHTFAFVMGGVFILQGLAVLYLKVLRRPLENQPVEYQETGLALRRGALCVYGVTALLPLSYMLQNSKGSFLLFGFGAEQTAIGTIALVVYALRDKIEWLLFLVPLGWISFYALAL